MPVNFSTVKPDLLMAKMTKLSKRPILAKTGKRHLDGSRSLWEIPMVRTSGFHCTGVPHGLIVFDSFCKKRKKLALNPAEIEITSRNQRFCQIWKALGRPPEDLFTKSSSRSVRYTGRFQKSSRAGGQICSGPGFDQSRPCANFSLSLRSHIPAAKDF